MDKGARFYRCDFQVHSPRDCNWKGDRPQTEDDRNAFARAFVAACRQKGLDAVAITDHHDVCFFPYIKAAAEAEQDSHGAPVPEHRRLVVFPGMELTLAVPCQALLVFDADIPVDVLSNLYPLLGVTQNPHDQPTHIQPQRLDEIPTFHALCELLDRNDYLVGRYIILPNVTDGGSSSIMRQGFTTIYKMMPCVGGYLDGPVSRICAGTRRILDGKIREYGERKLGLFQTSDNRSADLANLGVHSTWVKWATPKAEAIRQACLACETRLSHEQPVVPSMVITRLEVSDSRFLGPIDVYFNPQYSCLIGGRGTGKSTILEYVRWALCDQPPSYSDEDEAVAYHGKRANLIEKTLAAFEGVVTVCFLLDSVSHVVRRSAQTKEVGLKIGANDFRPCTEADIRDLLPLQAYSQKQLSAVGVRTEELVRFIQTPIKADLDRISAEIDRQKSHTKEVFSSLILQRKMQREQERDELELASLTQRVNALRQELKGVGEEDRQLLASHDLFLQEEQVVEGLERELSQVREMASDFRASLDKLPSELTGSDGTPNLELLVRIRAALAEVVNAAKSHIQAVIRLLADQSPQLERYAAVLGLWKAAFGDHNMRYEKAKQDASSHQSQLTQIGEAEAKIKGLRSSVSPLLESAGFTEADLHKLVQKLTPEEWLELSLTELEDIPVFEYRQAHGHYIQFSDASAGQQATALLRVLLNQKGPPLLIDQPEEDLDNQVILEIVEEIWKAKKGRQIIFSSHNPNIVVNGDADLVVCCDYRTAGDHSGGRIKCCGAIDVDEIRKEITVVMEGGRNAFRLRKDKYGF